MATGPALSLALTAMAFGGVPLFRDLRLEFPPGRVTAVVGRSGVGKTTLLRIAAGVETGFEGAALVDGVPAAEAPVPGFVFQDARLLPWLDAAANIRAVAPGATEAEVAGLMEAVGLGGRERAYPHELSGGMQRRLGLARALAVNARLLLLDEPFVSLDRTTVAEVTAQFRSVLAARRPTVLLVSHDPEDAARLAHRVVVLRGRPARVAVERDMPGEPARRSAAEVFALAAEIADAAGEVAA